MERDAWLIWRAGGEIIVKAKLRGSREKTFGLDGRVAKKANGPEPAG
jgi:hypothetical protein